MNNSLELTALRPILRIGRTSTRLRSRSVRNSVIPSVFLVTSSYGLGTGEQQDLVGLDRLGDPHLAAVDDVAVSVAFGERRDARGVKPGTGFGDPEADVQFAGRDRRQRARLELLGAVHRPPAAYRRSTGGSSWRRSCRRRTWRPPRASSVASVMPRPWPPYSFRNRHAEPAAVGDRLIELGRKLVRLVFFHPVVVVELSTPARRPTGGSAPGHRSARNSFHRRPLRNLL